MWPSQVRDFARRACSKVASGDEGAGRKLITDVLVDATATLAVVAPVLDLVERFVRDVEQPSQVIAVVVFP
jgi:hypothetical protein